VIHSAVLVAVHSQPVEPATEIVAVSPARLTLSGDGETLCVHAAPPLLGPAMRLTSPLSATT